MKLMRRLLPVTVVFLAVAVYSKLHNVPTATPATVPTSMPAASLSEPRSALPEPQSPPVESESNASFKCDGRTYCSQMTSCAEAKYFLDNCPGVKMDGDHDGVPCESQWCPNG